MEVWYLSQYSNSRFDSCLRNGNFGNGKGMKKSIPTIREREGNEKKTMPINQEREGNEQKAFPKFGKGVKKSIPIIRERESDAFILGNGGEREFPVPPD